MAKVLMTVIANCQLHTLVLWECDCKRLDMSLQCRKEKKALYGTKTKKKM